MASFRPSVAAVAYTGGVRRTSGALWLILAFAVIAASYPLFAESLEAVVSSFQQPEFSHGYIIPLISGWIVWQRRHLIASRRGDGAWSGWLVVASGVGLTTFSHAANLITPPYVGLLVVLFGLVVAAVGWASARLLIVPTAFMLLAYPMPEYLYIELSTTLQLVSSKIGAGVLDAVGVPVFLDGNIIDLGSLKLQVAEACSGLRYLLPLVTFGVLCAFMYRAPWWAKLLVLAVTVPLTIVLNGLRIAMTGLFVHFGSPSLAEGFMHLFEGWVVFLIALAVLFGFMFGMLRLLGWRGRLVDMLDFDRMAGTANGRPLPVTEPRTPLAVSRPLVASVATIVLAAMLLFPLASRSAVIPERPGLFTYPLVLADQSAVPHFLDAATEDVLGADDYLLLDFTVGDVPKVNLWVAYFDSLLKNSMVHRPTICLPGAGWEYVELGPHRTELVDLRGAPLVVNRGVVVKGEQRIVMYFWMELRGRSVQGLEYVKFVNLWDSLITGRSDGALVRLYTSLRPGEDPQAGDARIMELLKSAYPHLEPHVGA